MSFISLSQAIDTQIKKMIELGDLFEVAVDAQEVWDLYLASFPEGTNPVYKERTEHDCVCCRHFIRDMGNVVVIDGDKVVSIWDVNVGGHYQVVVDALAQFIRSKQIKSVFSTRQTKLGAKVTNQFLEHIDESGEVVYDSIQWNHFYADVPFAYADMTPTRLSEINSTVDVFKRGIEEITFAAIDTVLDLISDNNLYRGEEFRSSLLSFRNLKKEYDTTKRKDIFFWLNYKTLGSRIRNTVIGTLLQDLSEPDCDVEKAVRSYEQKVAPVNYKRPTALITKRMVEDAMKTINQLGIEPAFKRRFAVPSDISINNVLYADRNTASLMKNSLLSSLMEEVKETTVERKHAQEITIQDFISQVVPHTTKMEVLFDKKYASNMVSLIAPQDETAPNVLLWDNNFSWSYRGNVTDSIKEKVKRAGGNIDAYLRASLAWYNYDDLDLHALEPGSHIFYANKRSPRGGFLDVDMNVSPSTREPVENIAWKNKSNLVKGAYEIKVHCYTKREHVDVGFELELAVENETYLVSYDRAVSHHEYISVVSFEYDGNNIGNIKFGKDISQKSREVDIWGIKTGQFCTVSILTISPNHWDANRSGNKHYFFMLDGCKNDERPRGFYNEFLRPDLQKHRKVFEVLGDKTKCDISEQQLSGLGFSSTNKNNIICKCDNRLYNVLIG